MKNVLTIGGGVLTIVAMFLAFVKGGGIEVTGMQLPNNVGYFYIGCGAVITIVGLVGKRGLNILSLLLGLVVTGLAIKYQMDAKTEYTSAGIGLWVMLAGGVLAALGSVMALMQKKV